MHGTGSAVSFGYCKDISNEQILSKNTISPGYARISKQKMPAIATIYSKTQPGRSPNTSQGPPGRPPRDSRRAPRGSQEHRWTLQGLANDSQKALWSLPEAPLERCILHVGGVGVPYDSITNSIQNGPCSDAEDPQTTHRRPQKAF